MSNMHKEETQEEDYELEFIDPSELIQFQGEPGVLDARKLAPSAEKDEDETEYEAENEYESESFLSKVKESSSDYVIKSREDTRGRLALNYTVLTFIIFILAIIIAVIDGLHRNVSIIDNLREILPLLSGIFLGTLGFVLGYYFKKSEEK